MLDPAQNHTFRDHYLEVDLDLSKVLFLATANVVDTIPGPLLDRMEVIRLDGYTEEEKVAIARAPPRWPASWRARRSADEEVQVTDDALRPIVADYTREAGVRSARARAGPAAAQGGHPDRRRRPSDAAGRGRRRRRAGAGSAGRRFFFEAADRTAVPGVATGLAVTGAGGDVLFVEAATGHGRTRGA